MARFFRPRSLSPIHSPELQEARDMKCQMQTFITETKNIRKGISAFNEGLKTLYASANTSATYLTGINPILEGYFQNIAFNEPKINSVQEIAKSIEKKQKLMESLEQKCQKLENLQIQKSKIQKKVSDFQKRSDFENVSKFSRDLAALNEEFKELYTEVFAKIKYIVEMCTENDVLHKDRVCHEEIELFKLYQKEWLQNAGEKLTRDEEFKVDINLDDEFMKFEMKLEAKVVERKREVASGSAQKEKLNFTMDLNEDIRPKRKEKGRKSIGLVPVYKSLVAGFNGISTVVEDEKPVQVQEPKISIPEGEKFVALFDYVAQQKDEIDLTEFDILMVERQGDDGWFYGENTRTGNKGLFPGNYVQEYH